MNFKQELGWKFVWWKLNLSKSTNDLKLKHLRRKYCRYGFHKLSAGSTTYKYHSQNEIHIKYLTCKFCKWKFFANQEENDKFEKIEKKSGQRFISAILEDSSSSKSEHHNTVGESKSRDVSTSDTITVEDLHGKA